MKLKTSLIMLAILAMVFSGVSAVSAADFKFVTIEVNDLEVFPAGITNLDIERTNTVDVEVTIQGNAPIPGGVVDDVRVIAEINGYEFGEIKDVSEIFSLEENVTKKIALRMLLPDDIDASQFYTLRIRVVSDIDAIEQTFALHIDPMRHSLDIFDVVFNPSGAITAGNSLFVTTFVENLGEKSEENIKVTASIPKLGISASNFFGDDLVSQVQEENEKFREDRDAENKMDLLLRIPEDAPEGDYEVTIRVDYNRGNSFIEARRVLRILAAPVSAQLDTVIGPDSTSRTAAPNEEIMFKLNIANVGSVKGMFQVMLDGAQTWANARVEPSFLTVLPDAAGEVRIFVTPNADAEPKTYNFVARVIADKEVISEVPLSVRVTGEKASSAAPAPTWAFKNVLAVLFAVLVVVLIILGLIIAFRKVQEEDESPQPNAAEVQTYYYHPKR